MDSLKIEKPIEIFQLYIENHFELQTADFTTLSSDELIHYLNLRDKSNDRNAYWTVFVAEIENIYCNNQKSPLNKTMINVKIHLTSLTNLISANYCVTFYCAHKTILERWITACPSIPTSHQQISRLVAILITDELLIFKMHELRTYMTTIPSY